MENKNFIKSHNIIVLFFLLLTAFSSRSQSVLNVETMRLAFDSADNWIGSIEFGGSYQAEKIDQEQLTIGAATHVGYRKDKHLVLFLGSFVYETIGDYNVENKYNFHLRYNYQLHKRWFLEVFGQMQHNHQIELTRRDLVGIGARFIVLNSKKIKLNVGSLAMYEHQVISDSIYHKDIRSSNYVFLGLPLASNVHVLWTTYYQPLFTDFSNYRLSSEISLDVSINKTFSLVTTYVFYYDTEIERDVPSVKVPTTLVMMAFKINF